MQKFFWYSFWKAPEPCMSARCEGAFHFSNEYTTAPLLWNPRPRTALSPQLSSSANNLPVPSPLLSSQGAKAGAYLLLTQSEGLFSDNCTVSCEGGHLFTWADMRVSLPARVSKLAPVIRAESTPFDSSAQVLLVPETPSEEMVSQALGVLSGAPWPGFWLLRQSSAVPISSHLIPCQPPVEGAVNRRMLTPFPNCLLFLNHTEGKIMKETRWVQIPKYSAK